MAVRADVFREHKFGEGVEIGTETEFTLRAEGNGHRCWHFHASPVGHIIRPYQFKFEWLGQRAYNDGRGNATIYNIIHKETPRVYRAMKLIRGARGVAIAACKSARARLLGDDYDQLKAYLHLQYSRGVFAERRALAMSYRRPAPNATGE
jgi:hypothetical protein